MEKGDKIRMRELNRNKKKNRRRKTIQGSIKQIKIKGKKNEKNGEV